MIELSGLPVQVFGVSNLAHASPRLIASASSGNGTAGVAELENEIVEHFADLAAMLAQPRSYGQIYGLLFASTQPLSFTDIVERLDLSKGSVSQGLKALREAFDDTMKDPDFLGEAAKAKLPINPMGGEEFARIVDRLYEVPEPLVARARKALE